MTKTNKLIGGAVVVILGYYLYHNYKVKSKVADLKDGADYPAPPTPLYTPTPVPTISKLVTNINAKAEQEVDQKNFAGNMGTSMNAQYFR